MTRTLHLTFLLLLTPCVLGACTNREPAPAAEGGAPDSGVMDATVPGDGGASDTGSADAEPGMDGGGDAGTSGAARLYEHCATDDDCEEDLYCNTGYPQPICTRECVGHGICDAEGACVDNVCEPRCRSGARDCDRFGGACVGDTFCQPACGATEGAGFRCLRVCDSHRGTCDTTIRSRGAAIGDPCGAHEDCRTGIYVLMDTTGSGDPSGFVDGYCIGSTRYPGPSSDGGFEQGGCPPRSLMWDREFTEEGDQATCARACTRESDCREGYFCGIPRGHSRGVCLPARCDGLGEDACPMGSSCQVIDGVGRCGPCTPMCEGRSCGSDSCGGRCGTCDPMSRCTPSGACECVPEMDSALCAAASAECGVIEVTDRCGTDRRVECGTCRGRDSCGAEAPNQCGCVAETDRALCRAEGATCGTLTVRDRCGLRRSVNCGSCRSPATCGGAGVANECGVCTPSCSGRECGSDGCGGSCGGCPSGESCSSSGTCRTLPCDPVRNTLCPSGQRCEWTGSRTECITAGSGRAGAGCFSASSCAAEHTCTGEGFCREYCTRDADCGSGECAYELTGSSYGLCSRACNPNTAAGSSRCNPGEGCLLFNSARGTEVTDCGDYGSGFAGDSCGGTRDCFRGYTCASGSCARVCTLGTSCASGPCALVGGWFTYGVCPP